MPLTIKDLTTGVVLTTEQHCNGKSNAQCTPTISTLSVAASQNNN